MSSSVRFAAWIPAILAVPSTSPLGALRSATSRAVPADILTTALGGAVEVTLRAPPPLERELQISGADPVLTLRDGEVLLAEARRAQLDLKVPNPVSLDEAAAAAQRSRALREHPYP